MNHIKIIYVGREEGLCKTIFRTIEHPIRYYNRIDFCKGGWYTCYPSNGYYECCDFVSNNIIFDIVDKKGNILFSEGNENLDSFISIEKRAKQEAFKLSKSLSLRSHEDWRTILETAWSVESKDYLDNWLYFYQTVISKEVIDKYKHLGLIFEVTKSKIKHDKCDFTWEVILIENKNEDCVEAIVGYIF